MSLVHVFCSMERHWRMLHSVYRLALFSGPKGPVSQCHWMPVTMYPWCSKIHLFDLPLWMTDLHLVVLFHPPFKWMLVLVRAPRKNSWTWTLWPFFYYCSAHFVSLNVISDNYLNIFLGNPLILFLKICSWIWKFLIWTLHLFNN